MGISNIQEYFTVFVSGVHNIRGLASDKLIDHSFVIESEMEIDESELLSALKNEEYINVYRTKTLVKNKVRIVVNHGEIDLFLAKDSVHKNVCWVYYPKYRYSKHKRNR